MKSYCKGLEIDEAIVSEAFDEWRAGDAGRKNAWRVERDYGTPDALIAEIAREVRARSLQTTPIGYRMRVEPEVFADGNTTTTWDISKDAGKLAVIKNVSIKNGGYYDNAAKSYVSNVPFVPGESTYSTPDNSTSWYFKEQPDGQTGGVQIYTSNYADFAALPLPTGKMNITGVMKRYRDQWELIIRSIDDVEELK